MRIALLADIHGNTLALDAVLADIQQRGGAEAYWSLGDMCAMGYDPSGVLERLNALPNLVCIRGNSEDNLTGALPSPTPADARENPDLIPIVAEVAGNFGWVRGHLTGRGWYEWLGTLPAEHRTTLPDGTRTLLTHIAPYNPDDTGLIPTLTDDAFHERTASGAADLICVGHFHVPLDRMVNGVRAVNPGSVGVPFAPDLRAGYALLTAEPGRYHVTFHRVAYDREGAIAELRRLRHPGADFLIPFLEGRRRARWMETWDGVSYSVSENTP